MFSKGAPSASVAIAASQVTPLGRRRRISIAKVGKARMEATVRRIEIRVGEVLGEPEQGKRTDLSGAPDKFPLRRQEAHELRLLASHRDLVERVLAGADDAKPASRRRCLDAIRDHLSPDESDSLSREIAPNGAISGPRLLVQAVPCSLPWRCSVRTGRGTTLPGSSPV